MFVFRATLAAYGGSQARSPISAAAAATPDPSHIFDLHHNSRQYRILNLLSEARDQTHNLRFLVGFFSAVPQRALLYIEVEDDI